MPAKKKKKAGGKKKAKGGKKKGAKAASDKEADLNKVRELLKCYQQHGSLPGRVLFQDIIKTIKDGIENEKPPVKFFISVDPPFESQPLKEKNCDETIPTLPQRFLQPLTCSWVETRYLFVRCLCVWGLGLDDDAIVSLALYFESSVGSGLKALELRDTSLSPWAVNRLAKSLKRAQLSSINLDYNRLPASSVEKLCLGLQSCRSIISVSLNFCDIDCHCGAFLGAYAASSSVKELSLIGNALTCFGCSELIKPLVFLATPEAPLSPPALTKLLLADNSIDIYTPCPAGTFDSVLCTREIRRLLAGHACLEELNLEGNSLGEGGAREVLEGLQERTEKGFPKLRISVTSCISPELFSGITAMSTASKAAKKGKKKKAGKKKKK